MTVKVGQAARDKGTTVSQLARYAFEPDLAS